MKTAYRGYGLAEMIRTGRARGWYVLYGQRRIFYRQRKKLLLPYAAECVIV